MSKMNINDKQLVIHLINKMMESNNMTYEDVMRKQDSRNKLWNREYSWTMADAKNFEIFFKRFFKKKVRPKQSDEDVNNYFKWFIDIYGLDITENLKDEMTE